MNDEPSLPSRRFLHTRHTEAVPTLEWVACRWVEATATALTRV